MLPAIAALSDDCLWNISSTGAARMGLLVKKKMAPKAPAFKATFNSQKTQRFRAFAQALVPTSPCRSA
ncbi:hypothetical protein [Parvibaculum sp.]|uniref:hypothetical protein n=1 Tax=Parvibaculum sp. TaxID=2024848 RepID=UPI00391C2ADE